MAIRATSTDDRLDQLLTTVKGIRERLGRLESQVAALLRANMLHAPDDPIERLDHKRFAYCSQHEEDGLIHALFDEIGTTNKWFVEIGCGSNGGNSGLLARECGWSGLMVDVLKRAVRIMARQFDGKRVTPIEARVGSANVVPLLARYRCPPEFDLLGLDIDGTDYWVLDAIVAVHRPRVIVVEYNSTFGPDAAVTIPDIQSFERGTEGYAKLYHGASLGALCKLAERRDYRLILTDSSGTNAVFVRNDVGSHLPGTTAREAFRYYVRHRVAVDELGDAVAHFRASGLPLVDV